MLQDLLQLSSSPFEASRPPNHTRTALEVASSSLTNGRSIAAAPGRLALASGALLTGNGSDCAHPRLSSRSDRCVLYMGCGRGASLMQHQSNGALHSEHLGSEAQLGKHSHRPFGKYSNSQLPNGPPHLAQNPSILRVERPFHWLGKAKALRRAQLHAILCACACNLARWGSSPL